MVGAGGGAQRKVKMTDSQRQIRELIDRVRARWRRLIVFRATVRAGLAATAVLGVAIGLTYGMTGAPVALSVLAIIALGLLLGALAWGFWPIRRTPSPSPGCRCVRPAGRSKDSTARSWSRT